ncbi:nicotinate-nucleotide adenylyltransferase [Pseudidiomarina mangrovi]|uniref:nicotinate-nucleotide adenylyltransferase n=1 Tax=Pseudidiomarina mangrovi TaxID=2487133 RepID=UPI000FCB9443|nr:nicotinate-nucleotide adenylyltransferase [Pseudidiomarina mangrovi]
MLRLLLGGSFDPIHWGHLKPLLQAFELLQADQMVLLPSAQPPHRNGLGASAEQRFTMAQLAAAALAPAPCCADDWELKQQRPSYTAITLAQLAERWPHDTLVFVLGDDAFAKLDSWYNWQQLLHHAHLLVLQRPQAKVPWSPALQNLVQQRGAQSLLQLRQQTHGLIGFIASTDVAISATEIRAAISTQQPWQHLLPKTVANYIEQQQLYR